MRPTDPSRKNSVVCHVPARNRKGSLGELRKQQGEAMLAWLWRRVSRAGIRSKRGKVDLGQVGKLARSGPAVWILTQEKAPLDYLASKEEFERVKTKRAF